MVTSSATVLFVHHGGAHGGAPLCLLDVMNGVTARGAAVTVACRDPAAAEHFSRAGVQAVYAPAVLPFPHTTGGTYRLWYPPDVLRAFRWWRNRAKAEAQLIALIASTRAEVVYLNSVTLAPYAAACRAAGARVVLHVREVVPRGFAGIRSRWLAALLRGDVDRVLAVCDASVQSLPGAGAVTCIYDPVDLQRFRVARDSEVIRRRLGVKDGERIVLFAGGSDGRIKGELEFVSAMSEVFQRNRNVVAVMPGAVRRDDSRRRRLPGARSLYQMRLRKAHRRATETGHVVSTPFLGEIEDLIAASEVVAIPHTLPHASLTFGQAGACARAIVASRIAGLEEVVEDERSGLLVPPGDVRALAFAITRILEDGDLATRLGAGARRKVEEHFDAALWLPRIVDAVLGVE